ncbi:MAG TPA: 3-deoxy-D-manno-octulosonic acid transferase [Candidatus Angelobacter sp.]|nr:3-deoxy-D-manno-octulosonic acid transferase [Candidatus Angelobacter sp.]
MDKPARKAFAGMDNRSKNGVKADILYFFYSVSLAVLLLLSLPWWLFQMLRSGKYRAGLQERLGFPAERLARASRQRSIWIHAVSVGEVLAVASLVRELREQQDLKDENRDREVFVSTTTLSGQLLARARFGEDHVFYLPLDLGFAIRPYLKLLRPDLLILAETEFWPALLRLAKAGGSRIAVVNARISDRSFPRYKRFRWFFSPVLAQVDLFLAQTEDDASRLRQIGAPAERVHVSGNLKFDIRPAATSAIADSLRAAIHTDSNAPNSSIMVCGSTTEGEEQVLLQAFHEIAASYPAAVMVLAPRHPERFDKVADLIASLDLPYQRRSRWTPGQPISKGVFLLDSVGELASVYALADVAFVGGSLFPTGGHNILEPAQYGVAVVTGPHTFNFRQIVNIFRQGEALRVADASGLAREILNLLGNAEERQKLGQRAQALFAEHAGATLRTLHALQPLISESKVSESKPSEPKVETE